MKTVFSENAAMARPRFLSAADCRDLVQRLERFAVGGGYCGALVGSTWRGNVRWARNLVSTAGDVQQNVILVTRSLNGANSRLVQINDTSDIALVAAVRQAERLAALEVEHRGSDLITRQMQEPEDVVSPLFSETTFQLDAERQAEVARKLAQSSSAAGMMSAGYVEVSAHSMAFLTSWGITRYYQYTSAQYSVTVRDPKGTGSGWAGVDWPDWSKIDGEKLSAIALEKCLTSRNPVAIEPGRYTTILEPQAVADIVGPLFQEGYLDRATPGMMQNETSSFGPFNKEPSTLDPVNHPGYSKIGEQVVDARITISADPKDPELGLTPWWVWLMDSDPMSMVIPQVNHAATWIDRGVLTNLSYDLWYGLKSLGKSTGLPNSGGFRMSGGDTSIAEMIATTKRGLLVTRFDQVMRINPQSVLYRGYTRDGLWLIESGKISKPVKNLTFTESPLFILNNVEQLGMPQRVFHPPSGEDNWFPVVQPMIVPSLKVRDFSFTALIDAV